MRGPCGDTLITFARNVLALIYNLSEFTDIPVTEAALLAGINAFATAKAAQPSGGKAATATKNDKRDALIARLKTLANFV